MACLFALNIGYHPCTRYNPSMKTIILSAIALIIIIPRIADATKEPENHRTPPGKLAAVA